MTTDCSRLLRPGSDEMRDLRSSCELITMNRALHGTIGNGHTLVLTQMFMPRFNEERLQKSALLGGVFEYAPGIGGITAALLGQPSSAARNAFRFSGSIRYSTVTSTGPRSCSTSWVRVGAGQCMDGARSKPAPVETPQSAVRWWERLPLVSPP